MMIIHVQISLVIILSIILLAIASEWNRKLIQGIHINEAELNHMLSIASPFESLTQSMPSATARQSLIRKETSLGSRKPNSLPLVVDATTPGTSTSYENINLGTSSGGILINGLSAYKEIGNIVTILGDIDGDSHDDIMVGTVGALYVIYGTTSTSNINLATFTSSKGFIITGNFQPNKYYAKYTAMTGIGDINNDGFVDMMLGSVDPSTNIATFYVLQGANTFTDLDTSETSSFAAVYTINNVTMVSSNDDDDNGADYFSGITITSAGDFNGDGINDIAIGVVPYGSDGSAYIIYGSSDLSLLAIPTTSAQGISIAGPISSGFAISGAGDVNGDGFDDIVIGAPGANHDSGIVYVVYGSTNPRNISLTSLTSDQGFTMYGSGKPTTNNPYADTAGIAVSGAGDFNNDGYSDLVVGASYVNSGTGEIFIVYGSKDMDGIIVLDAITDEQGVKIFGASSGDQAGFSVSGGSDLNGDGVDDVVVGALYANKGFGGAYVIYGSSFPAPIVHLSALSTASGYSIVGVGYYGSTGFSLSSAGDINRDGYKDIVIGIPYFNNVNGKTIVSYVGSAYILFGQASGQTSFDLAGISAINQISCGTKSIIDVSIPGDLNADGYLDVLVGVATANSYTGSAYVMYGGVNGFRSIPRVDQMESYQGYSVSGINEGDYLGWSISGAGDINDDGIQDFLIGAPFSSNDAGEAFIVYGSNANRPNLALGNLTYQDGIKLSGIVEGDNLGSSVGSAGDFDGDGYDDIIVGAVNVNNDQGACYVIFGSPNISTYSIDLSLPSSKYFLTIHGVFKSGYSVSGAGDFNNDGYGDVIIGAPSANEQVGASYIVFGSNRRRDIFLSNLTSSGEGITISGEYSGDSAGYSVSGALDVNGDGYADVIIGAPFASNNAGSAYAIFGSISPTNVQLSSLGEKGFAIYGVPGNGLLGFSVNSAGDVNNDGFPDLIIGASSHGSFLQGSTYIIYGGRSPSNIDLAALVNSQGISIDGGVTIQLSGSSVDCAADKYGNALAVIGTLNSNDGAFYTIAPTAVMPTTKTIAPTAIPTHAPTPFPTYTPTKAPPPTFWDQNQAVILGVIIPSLFGFVPIYFSKEICFYVLDHWDSANYNRGIMQIGMYNMCKRIFLAGYVEAKESKKKKKELAAQNQRLLDNNEGNANAKEAVDASADTACIEMTALSQANYNDDSYCLSAVVNPMLEAGSSTAADRPNDARDPLASESQEQPRIATEDVYNEPYRVDVIVNAVHQIRYDNPLLNHPQLFDILLEARGSGGMRTVDRLLSGHASSITSADESSRALSTADTSCFYIPPNPFDYRSNYLPGYAGYHAYHAVFALLSAREIVEYLPFAYHLSHYCSMLMGAMPSYFPNITTNQYQYQWLSDEKLLLTGHLAIGLSASMMMHDRTSIIHASSSSIISSGLFGLRLRTTRFLNSWRSEILSSRTHQDPQSSRAWAKPQYCLASAFIHTAPSLAVCQLRFLGYLRLYPASTCQLSDVGLKLAIASSDCIHTLFAHPEHLIVPFRLISSSYEMPFILSWFLVLFLLMRFLKIKIFSRWTIAAMMVIYQLFSLVLRITFQQLKRGE
jgi:hypothetical protein